MINEGELRRAGYRKYHAQEERLLMLLCIRGKITEGQIEYERHGSMPVARTQYVYVQTSIMPAASKGSGGKATKL
jgi:hypothetical protein